MSSLKRSVLLFTIILIEGYVVLSTELLAIRQTTPFIGSGTDTISIIIAAVLMPLAFGYQTGGTFKPYKLLNTFITVRKKLVLNIVCATAILTLGMSYRFLYSFFYFLAKLDINDRLLQTSFYCALFIVIPIYLLGQTVPLITNFFPKDTAPRITGKILFISTVGSFLGATFSTLILMSTIGVNHTITLNFLLLTTLVILLNKNKKSFSVWSMVLLFSFGLILNSNIVLSRLNIVKNNRYATISISHNNGYNHLHTNHNYDSKYNPITKGKHEYIEFAEEIAINSIMNNENEPPKEILVVGAGGFTFGHNDKKNHYTYVDIDPDLKDIAEQRILKEPIGENKIFVPEEIRAYLLYNKKKYDLIYLDAYLGGLSIPEHLVTQEFFQQVKNALNNNGVLITNFILSPNFKNTFTKSLDNTFRSVFPHTSRHALSNMYLPWNKSKNAVTNIAYIYVHEENYEPGTIYTDDKNTVFIEKPKKLGD